MNLSDEDTKIILDILNKENKVPVIPLRGLYLNQHQYALMISILEKERLASKKDEVKLADLREIMSSINVLRLAEYLDLTETYQTRHNRIMEAAKKDV